jgi:hypothetical protein
MTVLPTTASSLSKTTAKSSPESQSTSKLSLEKDSLAVTQTTAKSPNLDAKATTTVAPAAALAKVHKEDAGAYFLFSFPTFG